MATTNVERFAKINEQYAGRLGQVHDKCRPKSFVPVVPCDLTFSSSGISQVNQEPLGWR
jgi:hypothetical protein